MRTAREVCVLIRRGDEVLMLHRAASRGGYWNVCCGGVEDDETDEAAALRELREEVGLAGDVALGDLALPYVYPIGAAEQGLRFPAGTLEITGRAFQIAVPAAWEPTLNEEHDAFRWCAPDEAAAIAYWPEVREAIVSVTRPAP